MIILGFDPSLTQFGWAVHDTSAVGLARCPERGRFKTGNETLFIDRYTSLRDQVRELVCRIKPDKLGIESPVFGELYSEGMYGLFLYVCEAMRLERQDFVLFSPMQTKAHARICLGRAPDWKMMKPGPILEVDLRAVGGYQGHGRQGQVEPQRGGRLLGGGHGRAVLAIPRRDAQPPAADPHRTTTICADSHLPTR